MCGIAAFFSRHPIIEKSQIERATHSLGHRGPDGVQHWVSPSKKAGLGHVRLSIIDLVTGDQPIASQDGTKRIIHNGEFYDFDRIRKDLEKGGHRFRTKSDSEIALHLFEDLGAHCLDHLRGEFAFVIWDETSKELFAARDRFGIKPLFYAFHEGIWYFASEIKAILAAGVPARWDAEALHQLHNLGTFTQDRTLFAGIYQIPPGHYFCLSEGSARLVRYWDFPYPRLSEPQSPRADSTYVEEFRETLNEAIRLRLRADVPVGCYLSGGLDSCSILGMASRHVSQPIHAFTLSFDKPEYDEAAVAEEMARFAGALYVALPMHSGNMTENFRQAVWHAETLFTNPHGVAKFLLSRAVRQAGYKVVLTGEGSDEILAGYAHFRKDLLLYGSHGQDPALVGQLLEELKRTNTASQWALMSSSESEEGKILKHVLGYLPSWMESFHAVGQIVAPLLSDEFKHEMRGKNPYRYFLDGLDIAERVSGRDPVNQSLYLWSKIFLPNYLLTVLGDRMEMAHSIEGRVPFLDHKLVELACRLPVNLKIRGMTEKYILREAAKPFLTKTVYERQKHPFMAPPVSLTPRQPLYEMMQDTLRGNSLAKLPFYNPAKILPLLDRVGSPEPAERAGLDTPLIFILSACVLQEQFKMTA